MLWCQHVNLILFRSYLDGDAYVGLYRTGRVCSCRGFSDSACETCRASWRWDDGTAMSWWNWQDDEPNEFTCGRISNDAWAENDCTEELRYICERGTSCCKWHKSCWRFVNTNIWRIVKFSIFQKLMSVFQIHVLTETARMGWIYTYVNVKMATLVLTALKISLNAAPVHVYLVNV